MKEGLVRPEQELQRRKLIASYLLLSVSMIAAFYQRIGLVNNEAVYAATGWVLAFAGAVATPLALMYAAPLLGQLTEFQNQKDRQWHIEAQAKFEASQEYELSQRELRDALEESERRRMAAEELAKAEQAKLLSAIRRGKVAITSPDHTINVLPAQPAPIFLHNGNGHADNNGKQSTRQIINDYLLLKGLQLGDAIESAEVARWYENKSGLPHDPNLNTAIRTQLSRMRKEAGITINEG